MLILTLDKVAQTTELTEQTVDELIRLSDGCAGVDIFLTNQWPQGLVDQLPFVQNNVAANSSSESNRPTGISAGVTQIARTAFSLKPRSFIPYISWSHF